jgi:hypothetical protein
MTAYRGGCQCGAVRFRVELDLSKPVTACNCSMCGRAGTLHTFAPAAQFTLEQGEESLTDYQFGKKRLHHLFCRVCGIKPFTRGEGPTGPMVGINARCLDDVDPTALALRHFDGKSL